MKFVAAHTTIPVPKVVCAFERKGITYIVMEAIQGEVIANSWTKRPERSKTKLLHELRDYVSQLRAIPHPRPGMVAAADLSKMTDFRIPAGRVGFGPFANSEEFHSFLREGLSGDGLSGDLKRLVSMHQAREYPTYFTHGDLSPLNILVRDEHIVGIVDWEMAGWLPDYWEYTSAINVHPFWPFWRDEVGQFLNPYEEEVEMEKLRQQYFSDT